MCIVKETPDTGSSDGPNGPTAPLMPSESKYAKSLVDVSSRHSVVIVSKRKGLIQPDDDQVVVDYFYHEGEYWRARIPLNGVADVFGQVFNFSKKKTRAGPDGPEVVFDKHGLPRRTLAILNHLQSRFTLRSDFAVELFPLGDARCVDPTYRIRDFVYSLEAVGPVGVSFNLRDGLAGNLVCAHRFLAIREMVFERLVVENQYVTESPPLPIDAAAKRELLVESLMRSHRAGMNDRYYLYRVCGTNNCTSNPFQILDNVVDYGFMQRIGSAAYRLPLSPRFYLRVRGLDADPTYRKLVRTEFVDYINDPVTRKRKRDHVRRLRAARSIAREARRQGIIDEMSPRDDRG